MSINACRTKDQPINVISKITHALLHMLQVWIVHSQQEFERGCINSSFSVAILTFIGKISHEQGYCTYLQFPFAVIKILYLYQKSCTDFASFFWYGLTPFQKLLLMKNFLEKTWIWIFNTILPASYVPGNGTSSLYLKLRRFTVAVISCINFREVYHLKQLKIINYFCKKAPRENSKATPSIPKVCKLLVRGAVRALTNI